MAEARACAYDGVRDRDRPRPEQGGTPYRYADWRSSETHLPAPRVSISGSCTEGTKASARNIPTWRSPNLNAYAERWVRSVKEECLCKVVLFGERSLRRALSEYVEHFHAERNDQGKGNILLFPRDTDVCRAGPVQCRERLGGLLRYYHQEAA
jgi:hypothetical protein